jgi:tetratricopeptide (TPR) repeat protein
MQGTSTLVTLLLSGDYSSGQALADQILDLALREGSHTSLGFAHLAQAELRFYRGDLVGVEEHFARFRIFSEAPGLREYPGAVMGPAGFASLGLWMLGYPEKALSRIAEAIALVRDEKKPFDIMMGRNFESYLYRWLKEPQHAADAATEELAIAEEHGFSDYRESTSRILGWARAQLGQPREGVALIRESLAGQAATGARMDITNILTMLAEAQALDGAIDDALITLDEALVANSAELVFRPNILTWRGELRLKTGQPELAEADFREAIALAQKMSAKMFELRAATSLARLLRDTNRRDEARAMLAEGYNWFTEGFDTADLKDAKALLEELNV